MRRVFRAALCAAIISVIGAGLAVAPAQAGTAQETVVDDVPSAATPDVADGTVYAIAKVGGKVIIGGTFTSATSPGSSTPVPRSNILAFDATTGEIDPAFVPTINGEVKAIIPGPSNTVYVAGAFNSVNGVTQRLVRLNVGNGAIATGWKSQVNAQTSSVVLSNGVLFVGGAFTMVNGVAQNRLAALDPTTGKRLDWFSVGVAGRHGTGSAQGPLGPKDIEIDPTGTKMVVIGNFTSATDIGGTVDRDQVMLVDLGPSTASINRNWRTLQFTGQCANGAFDSWVRDVDIDPSGTYFVVANTGASGTNTDGSRALCDSAARFELSGSGTNVQPTWVCWTGRDSLWSVAITGSAVYVGGHQRWLNNYNGNDSAGAGSVPRPGLAAIDPASGVPLPWNPGRHPRGAGAFALLATDTGLYVGSDTAYVGDFTYRRERIAFFPLAGGSAVPSDATGTLPGTVMMAGGFSSATASNILYRVNAAGGSLSALDGGRSWESDNSWFSTGYHNSGSSTTSYFTSIPVDSTVPTSTPSSVFNSERYDTGRAGDNGEMKWSFPVTAGTPVAVRLYFAERYWSSVGQRKFDVAIDGATVLSSFDILAATGRNRGTMREFQVTSDGTVNIDFGHVVDHPLVDAVEIVKVTPQTGIDPKALRSVHLDTDLALGAAGVVDATTMDWSTTRGAFAVAGYVYYGKADATFNRRSFDGSAFGPEERVDPYNDPVWSSVDTGSGQTYRGVVPSLYGQLGSVTSMFYANHRIYYTLGTSAMYYRAFVPGGGIMGERQYTVADGRDWSQVAGAVVVGDTMYYALKTGALMKVSWANGQADGAATTVDSSLNWATRSMFVVPDSVPINLAPEAHITVSCPLGTLACDLDASASSDPDGTIARYDWDFGDGATAVDAGATVSHTYAAAGSYPVTLTVTDDGGATTSTQVLGAPTETGPAAGIAFRAAAEAPTRSSTSVSVTVPNEVVVGDTLLLIETVNSAAVSTADPAGWQLAGTIKNQNALMTRFYVKSATAADVGSSVSMTYSATAKVSAVILAYSGVDTANPIAALATGLDDATSAHVTPTTTLSAPGRWVISYWADKSPTAATSWSAPADVVTRSAFVGGGSGAVTQLVADSGDQVPTGSYGGKTATVDIASNKGATATVVLQAG